MANHIFRLYTGGSDTIQGWNNSPSFPYNSRARETIINPDGATARNEITSIPSPFARIDLVKNAFREVCDSNDLDGDTIFHKMVSDSLDVGELFFNIDKFSDQLEIIVWDANKSIESLAQSPSKGHQYLADALKKYMEADAKTYNFDKMQNIYILNYKNGSAPINIIGATSPATLFFSNANDLSEYSKSLAFNQDKAFDDTYQPLYKREPKYVEAWFTLKKTIHNFATLFPEVNEYLEKTFARIENNEQKQTLRDITETNKESFNDIKVTRGTQTNIVEVLGYDLLRKKINISAIESDFEIRATRPTSEKVLVLPIEKGNTYSNLHYITDNWGYNNYAPILDEAPMNKRTLPHEGTKMPYLTISDFLEDTLVRVPHTLNENNYFNGNITIEKKKLSYLIPLKPLFFKYFTEDDLVNTTDGQKPILTMKMVAGESIKVILNIPIKGDGRVSSIEYQRTYYNNDIEPKIEQNKGAIIEFKFTGMIMPFIKYKEESEALYNVACVNSDKLNYELSFYQGENRITDITPKCRYENGDFMKLKANVYTVKHNFDYIQIGQGKWKAVIVPKFKSQQIINTFKFAIDLGTSNTHIEYVKNKEIQSSPFTYGKGENLISHMFNPSTMSVSGKMVQDDLIEENDLINGDFLPLHVGEDTDFHFPTRTVLSCNKHTIQPERVTFETQNIPLDYDKRLPLDYNDYKWDIKWTTGEDKNLMRAYVDCLMQILRLKVLSNGGNLSKTEIVWFYPSSMPSKRVADMKDAWNKAYQRYFNEEGTTTYMTESFAPIQFYFGKYATATNLVNIDIGGGSTDIAYAMNQEVKFSTSFRFATNNLFEDAYASINNNNGIIDYYKDRIKGVIDQMAHDTLNIKKLSDLFNINDHNNPANMASFLFSLRDRPSLKDKDTMQIDLNELLNDDEDFKIVFILFFTAIIYHVAQIVKLKGLPTPRHISFGGNGSKILRVITKDPTILADYIQKIFEIAGNSTDDNLEVLGLEGKISPKESTCKGGILGAPSEKEDTELLVLKSDGKTFVGDNDTYSILNDKYLNQTKEIVDEFFDKFFELNDKFNFDEHFGVNSETLNIAKDVCKQDVFTYLQKGVSIKMDEVEESDKINETLFFYPIKGIINKLSQTIFEKIKQKP